MENSTKNNFEAVVLEGADIKFSFPSLSYNQSGYSYEQSPCLRTSADVFKNNFEKNLELNLNEVTDSESTWVKKMEYSFKNCTGPSFIDSLNDVCSIDLNISNLF
jgi:hypothetical protein